MTQCSGTSGASDDPLAGLSKLAAAAVAHSGDGLLLESDRTPLLAYSYTEPHFALQLYLLHRAGRRPGGLDEAVNRLRLWDGLQIKPIFFCSMAIAVLGILTREDDISHAELLQSIRAIQKRRSDYTETAWNWSCGNNMYTQQVVTDALLAPLAEGRNIGSDATQLIRSTFESCLGQDGYFFDLPRPGIAGMRQFPLTYNLKFLFLLILSHHYLAHDSRLEQLLIRGLESTLQLFTREGDCSYFGRTDRSTFAAGLADFCIRAAVSMDIGGHRAREILSATEERLAKFPIGTDGCIEVNEYPLPASAQHLIWSRDDYAFRWQYAVAGAAYSLLGRRLFPGANSSSAVDKRDRSGYAYESKDLGIIRLTQGDQDVIIKTVSGTVVGDRRHAGPTILRFEKAGRNLIGTIPKTISSDCRAHDRESGGSRLSRHIDLIRYRWHHGYETYQAELAGFVPVLRRGRFHYVPGALLDQSVSNGRVTTRHRFQRVAVAGPTAVWNHLAALMRIRLPRFLQFLFPDRSVFRREYDIFLNREISVTDGRIRIEDSIDGATTGATLVVGSRTLADVEVTTRNLVRTDLLKGWGSEGLSYLQMYSPEVTRGGFRYEILLSYQPDD